MNGGFWKSGIQRAKSNTKRLGDKINNNIDEMKTVDMGIDGVLFADRDLIVNCEDVFVLEEIKSLVPIIESYGWRIPHMDEMNNWFFRLNYFIDKKKYNILEEVKLNESDDISYFQIESRKTKEKLYFPLTEELDENYFYKYDPTQYILLPDFDRDIEECGIFSIAPERPTPVAVQGTFCGVRPSRIRLVKNK